MKATTISDGAKGDSNGDVGQTYAKFTTNSIELYVKNQRALQVSTTSDSSSNDVASGVLHGAWQSEATVTTSDRRLKTSIEPLYRTLAQHVNKARGTTGDAGTTLLNRGRDTPLPASAAASSKNNEPPVGWLLRELRPVSFKLKRGPEAKYLKFGFIAQELETVFPNLVRTMGEEQTKAVATQDLIAVLTLALQTLQRQLEEQTREMEAQQARLERLERVVFASQQYSQRPVQV